MEVAVLITLMGPLLLLTLRIVDVDTYSNNGWRRGMETTTRTLNEIITTATATESNRIESNRIESINYHPTDGPSSTIISISFIIRTTESNYLILLLQQDRPYTNNTEGRKDKHHQPSRRNNSCTLSLCGCRAVSALLLCFILFVSQNKSIGGASVGRIHHNIINLLLQKRGYHYTTFSE